MVSETEVLSFCGMFLHYGLSILFFLFFRLTDFPHEACLPSVLAGCCTYPIDLSLEAAEWSL